MKKILITGTGSFIGMSFEKWLSRYSDSYQVDSITTFNDEWRNVDFSLYDVVFDVAGIAHIKITPDMEPLFYKVNRDLAIELCNKAKDSGVNQFIYLSSMNVFGDINEKIGKDTIPVPKNFYGMSKLQADENIQAMNNNEYKVVSIRPPVVYGKGCKGNFVRLEKLAKHTPLFPDYPNQRSMIYIDNLCELIKQIIDNSESGIFYPQNNEYVSTSQIVEQMAVISSKKILFTKLLNPIIRSLIPKIRVVNKAFGDDLYDMELSNYRNFSYCIVNFKDSIKDTV